MSRILLEPSISTKIPGVLPEQSFIEVVEGRLPVDIVGDDPGPVVVAAVAGGPLGEPLDLATDTVRLLRQYLRDRWKDTDALFPIRLSDRLTTRSLQHLVEKLATEADVQPQVDGGCLEDVQLRLRYANRQTTGQIYSHLVPR